MRSTNITRRKADDGKVVKTDWEYEKNEACDSGKPRFFALGYLFLCDKAFAFHFDGFFHSHDVQKRGGYVAKRAGLFERGFCVLVAGDDERHEVGGVRSAGRPVVKAHLFGVAVVGGNERGAARCLNCRNEL